jgi:methyl-accepting chemotaxis protein
LGFVFLTLLVSAGSFVFYYFLTRSYLVGELRGRLYDLASLGALTVDPDAFFRLADQARAGTDAETVESGKDYLLVSNQLNLIRDLEPDLILYAYTLIPGKNDKTALFVVDADLLAGKEEGWTEEDLSRFAEEYDISEFPVVNVSFGGEAKVEPGFKYDADYDVHSISGYAPVRDRSGRVLGILGLDISNNQITAYSFKLFRTVLILIGGMLTLSLVIGYLIARRTAIPFLLMTRLFDEAGKGDLTLRYSARSSDLEIGRAALSYNRFMDQLEESLAGFRNFTAQLSDTALAIRDVSEKITRAREDQSSVLSDVESVSEILTAAVMETESRTGREKSVVDDNIRLLGEVSAGLTRLQEISDEVRRKSDESFETVELSLRGMEETLRLTSDMAGVTRELTEDISGIDERADRIGEIVQTVDSFADRLRTLSINTSIEAARLGKEGSGFRVIAQEIKKLAEAVSDYLQTADEKVEGLKKSSATARERSDRAAASFSRLGQLSGESGVKLQSGKRAMLEIREAEMRMMENVLSQKSSAELVTRSSAGLREGVESLIRVLEAEKATLGKVQSSSNKLREWAGTYGDIAGSLGTCSRELLEWCSRLNLSLSKYHLKPLEQEEPEEL